MNSYRIQSKPQAKTQSYKIGASILLTMAILITFGLAFSHAIGASIKNQDTMLCNSAKVSGNREYLNKCQCYYSLGDIECLQEIIK